MNKELQKAFRDLELSSELLRVTRNRLARLLARIPTETENLRIQAANVVENIKTIEKILP